MTAHVVNVVLSGVFHASILFLVSAGLQVVFGVQKIFNLACGSFYALGAYVGVSAVGWYPEGGGPPPPFLAPPARAGGARGAGGGGGRRGPPRLVLGPGRALPPPLTLPHVPLVWGGGPRAPDPHRVRSHHPRQRRQPRDGGGARRGHAAPLRDGLRARHGPGHPGRRARHPGDGGDERDGHRADRGGLRRRGDRRPRVHAGRPRRRARRRRAPVHRDLRVPGARDAPDLSDRDRGAGAPAARPVRRSTRVSGRFVLALALGATVLAPLVAPTYHVLLMLPFMAYAVALLGLNLLFGYTGLVSFGHALFLGVGAYTGAFLTSVFKVRSMEAILAAAAALGALVAAPVGALCVRYVKIYFGMLTLAFGMVFYTF